jgi:hypothetical protein
MILFNLHIRYQNMNIEDKLVSLKNNLDISENLSDLIIDTLIEIILSFIRQF